MSNSHFYNKICYSKKGIKIVASSQVSDASMHRAAYLLDHVLAKVDRRVLKNMNHNNYKHAIMATYPKEKTLDIPEHSYLEDPE